MGTCSQSSISARSLGRHAIPTQPPADAFPVRSRISATAPGQAIRASTRRSTDRVRGRDANPALCLRHRRTATADAPALQPGAFLRLGSPIASTNNGSNIESSPLLRRQPTNSARSEARLITNQSAHPTGRQPGEAGIQPRLAGHTKFPATTSHSDSRYRCSGRANFRGHRTATRSSRGVR